MISHFLKIAGVKTEQAFYKKYPSEQAFFEAHPEAAHLAQAGGNIDGTQPQMEHTGVYDYSKGFKAVNSLLDLTGGIAHQINNAKDALTYFLRLCPSYAIILNITD